MKTLKNGIKIRRVEFDLHTKLIHITYEKGINVEHITLTIEEATEICFINFENLKL